MMVNYLKPCFCFGFDKYMVGAQRQQHISVHALSFTHDRRKRCRYTQAYKRTRGHCIFFPEFFRDMDHTSKLFVIVTKLDVDFSSK